MKKYLNFQRYISETQPELYDKAERLAKFGAEEITVTDDDGNSVTKWKHYQAYLDGVIDYGAFVSAIIRTIYSSDEEDAINNNKMTVLIDNTLSAEKVAEYNEEYEGFQEWRVIAKTTASSIIRNYY